MAPMPTDKLPPELAKLATSVVDEVGSKTGMPPEGAPPSEEPTGDEPSASEGAMGMPTDVPPEFIDAAKAMDKEGLPDDQIARILSGMLKAGMIMADDDPKKVGREFKVTVGSPKKLLTAIGASSEMPAPQSGGGVL